MHLSIVMLVHFCPSLYTDGYLYRSEINNADAMLISATCKVNNADVMLISTTCKFNIADVMLNFTVLEINIWFVMLISKLEEHAGQVLKRLSATCPS